jgi:hypothetical protein
MYGAVTENNVSLFCNVLKLLMLPLLHVLSCCLSLGQAFLEILKGEFQPSKHAKLLQQQSSKAEAVLVEGQTQQDLKVAAGGAYQALKDAGAKDSSP